MNRLAVPRKWLVIILLLIVAVAAVIIFFVVKNNKPDTVSIVSSSQNDTGAFTVSNASDYESDIQQTALEGLQTSIYNYIKTSADDTTRYTGVIRSGSLHKKSSSDGTQTTFLVDIPSIKRTYKVTYSNDPSTGYEALYVLCPSADELVYPPFECKDDLSES